MSRSKTGTPPVAIDHPAHQLTYVDEEMKQQLLKTPVALVLEQDTYKLQLKDLRNDWRYAWVVQWLYYFRGAIRLSGEPFTVDLLEEELVGLTEPNLINKIPTNLAATMLNTKVTIDDFSFRARFLLGDATSVLGTEENPVDYQSLSLVDKIEVLYSLISQLQYTDIFRQQVEKYEKESELRFEPIYDDEKTSFYLLSDNRIYKRTIVSMPKMEVPRKFKRAKLLDPEVDFAEIEPIVEWEVVAIGIYQIHEFLVSLKSNKKMKALFSNIKEHINDLAQEDLNTRKKILKRKREQKLHHLVSNRKRSSRLVEKEEQTRAERLKQLELEEKYKKEQEKARVQRRYKQKLNQLKKDIEERLKRQTQSRRSAILEELNPSSLEGVELGEGEWLFECYCGIREKNYDDGVKMVVCERCQRWQHLKCQDRTVRQELATKADEALICQWCMNELEKEVAEKLEAQRVAAEEAEKEKERQRELQRELHRKKMEEERRLLDEQERLLEEAERKRRDDMEKDRQRRFLERQAGLTPSSSGTENVSPNGSHALPPVAVSNGMPPMMGTFQNGPSGPHVVPNGVYPMPSMPMQPQAGAQWSRPPHPFMNGQQWQSPQLPLNTPLPIQNTPLPPLQQPHQQQSATPAQSQPAQAPSENGGGSSSNGGSGVFSVQSLIQ